MSAAAPNDPAPPNPPAPPAAELDVVRFFELSLDLFCIANLDGYFLRVNKNFSRLLGYADREFTTRPFLDFVHPGDQAATVAEMSKLMDGLPVVQFRNRYRDSHNEYHWLEWTARSVVEEGLIYAVARDVTEARLAESQRIARVGSWEWRVAANQNWWSDEYYRILGLRPGEFKPSREVFMERVHPEDRVLIDRWLESTMNRDKPTNFEFRIVRPDGEERILWSESHLELDSAGQLYRVSGTVQDITERKHAQEERRLLDQKLQEAQKLESLGVLTGGIAHDFNNLLAAILGSASLMNTKLPADSPLRSPLDKILTASERAAALCRQMLAYSGRGQFVLADVDLNGVIRGLIELLKMSISKKVVMKLELAEPLPAVRADVTQLGQVLMNLIINASESMGDRTGRIRIATGCRFVDRAELASFSPGHDLPEGTYVTLEVADNGCGMDDATRRKIFEPFFTTKFAGRGLGLAAVLGIVRGHQGAIQVASEVDRGTTFQLLLPARSGGVTIVPNARTVDDWQGEGLVLLADDDDLVRESTSQMLQTLGFRTTLAIDGDEALTRFRAAPDSFRFVLLDLTMPKLDGEEVFRTLQSLRPKLPVILMSGFSAQDAAGRFAGLDLAGFLAKPFTLEELSGCIRAALVG